LAFLGSRTRKSKELEDAFVTVKEKNAVISSIIKQQKEIIKLRTQEIANKNKRVLAISILKAHNVQEPFSRILGLISLVDHYHPSDEIKIGIIPKLKESSTDLDLALQDVITRATTDLVELKA
jgi:light-regulated signal transduction histidine kinase (bacteriophytochrome)